MKIKFVKIIVFLFFIVNNVYATEYYVNAATGSNIPGNGSSSGSPWKTITYALSQISGSGNTINVASGTYDTTLGEVFPIYLENGISLTGAGIDLSIVDGTGSGTSVFYCVSIIDASTTFSGFTVKGGGGSQGGGLFVTAGSALRIANNKISENSASSGSGIYILNSAPKIVNNSFILNGNTSIYISNSSPVVKGNKIVNNLDNSIYITGSSSTPSIINNVIANNTTNGIYCTSSCIPSIVNNTISDNSSNGIYVYSSTPDSIVNNIISFNSGYGIYESSTSSDPGIVSYNLFYLNSSGFYWDEGSTGYNTIDAMNSGVTGCNNNIGGDPLFVDKPAYDFHELPYSPAIDAGDPLSAYNNEPESNGDRINIGAYGNTTEAVIYSVPPTWSTMLYVDASAGSNSTGDGSSGNPWQTITYALSRISGTGYTINVAAGTYNTALGELFPIYMKNGVSLTGAGIDVSIIDAGQTNSVIKCISILDQSTNLEGFTIKGGYLTYPSNAAGPGIYIGAGSLIRIANNKISDNIIDHHPWNMGTQKGVGIYIENSSPIILNNLITNNSGDFTLGSGIYVYNSSPLVKGNRIAGNPCWNGAYGDGSQLEISGSLSSPAIINNIIADSYEHGIRCTVSSNPTLRNNLVINNTRDGIQAMSSDPGIINNTISGNGGTGIYVSTSTLDSIINNIISYNSGYGIYENGTSVDPGKVWYNLFYANTSGLYKDEGSTDYYSAGSLNSGVAECKNNIDGDPLFVDRINNDFNLLSGSPAIDAGDPNSPLDPDGSRADIGAYHYIMPPPDAPVANSPTFIGLTDLILNWSGSATATGYVIDLTTDISFSTFVSGFENRDVLNVTSYSVIGLTANTTYYYRIRAYNNTGTSPNSNEITIITLLSPPASPSAPVSDSPSNMSRTTFTASWSSVATATSYRLDVATDNTFTGFVAGYSDFEVVNSTSFQVTGLIANTEYFYRVRASNSGGQSDNSNTVSGTTWPDPPLAPEGVNYSDVTQTSFTSYWNSTATATGYSLDVATDDAFTTFVSGYNNKDVANVTTTPVTGLTAYTNYYFRIRAYNVSGTSPSSSVVSILTLQIPAPEAPTALSESNKTQTSFYANWNASATATGYFLDVATDDAFTSFVTGYNNKTLANVITSQVSGLSPNTTYYYRVRAFNAGGTSPSSNTISLTTLQILPPAAPAALDPSGITQTGFTANWNNSATATGYILDVAGDAAFTDWIAGAAYANLDVSNVTSYDVTGLSPNTTYYYRLSAYNAGGQSSYSIVIPVTTIDYPPAAPTANEATNRGLRNFAANWSNLANATGYYLDVASNSSFTTFLTGYNNKDVLNTLSWNVTDLTPGTTYYYRVRAYNTGGASGNSNIITANTLQIPVTDHYVDVSTGNNSTGDGTYAKPWKTITYALERISGTGRHKINVAAGNYNTTSGELFPLMPGDSISLIGSGKNVTIIDAGNTNTVIKCSGILDPQVTIEGFSITGGKSTLSNNAGGIYISGGSVFTISDNIITANRAEGSASGGAIYVYWASPTIKRNVISLNHGQIINNGASVFIEGSASAPLIMENTITGNINDIIAGGTVGAGTLVISGSSGTIIKNNVIKDNNPGGGYSNSKDGGEISIVSCSPTIKYNLITKSLGNGIFVYNSASSPSIINNTISDNTYDGIFLYSSKPDSVFNNIISYNSGYGINEYGSASDPARVEYNLFYQNSLGLYYDEGNTVVTSVPTLNSTVTECKNNISGNPMFVDKSNNKYGLTAGSAAIDAGDPGSPLDPNGTRADIGAYYYIPLPAAPVANAATYLGTTEFTANWSSSATATGYYLDVATDNAFTSFVAGYNNRDVLDVTSFNVTGLTENTDYYYRVRAYNSGGTSSSSNTINVTTLLNPPSAPVCITESGLTQTSFTAKWNSTATATGYYLDVATDNGFTSFVAGYNNVDVLNVTSFNVTGLTANSDYYYRVRAYNSAGTSGNSNTISVTTLLNPPSPPSAPVCISESNLTQTSFTANWNYSATATGYYLDVATDNGFTSFVSGYSNRDVSDVTSFNVTGLTANSTYYYRVRAYNSGGTSSNSNTISVTTLLNPPSPPVCTTESSLTQSSFTANWNSSATATGYYLDVATDNGFTSFVSGYSNRDVSDVTSFNVTGLTANSTYYYRVRAYNSGGTSSNSNTISVTTLLNPPSPPVCTTESSLTQTSFTANWNSSATATGYYLDVATDNGFTSFVSGYNNRDVFNVTSFNVTGLTANTTYYYRVRAYNSGGTSSNSNTISVTTLLNPPSPPSAPVCISETNLTQTSFTANWNSSTTATGYYLDVATDISFSSFVSGYSNRDVSDVTSFNITGLTANTDYYYRVRAYNSGGTSSSSNTISVTTLLNPPSPPSAPVCISETNLTQTSFTANWNSSATATGYYLDVATDISFSSFVSGYSNRDVSDVTSFNITGLTANTDYYYRVRAYNSGGTSSNSNTISVTTLLNPPSPPSAPVCITESGLTQTSFTANWNNTTTATGYYLDVATDISYTSFVAGYNNRDVSDVTSFNVTGLTANTDYYYRVRAYNSGGTSSSSNTINVTTLLNPPSAPVCITESGLTQTSFTANWNSTATATGYYLDVATDNSFNTYVSGYNNKDAGLTTNLTVTGLSAKSNYFYRVRAYNGSGTGVNSNIISVTTLPMPPAAPTGLLASSCNNNVTLTWNAISETDFLRYRIYGGTTSNPTKLIDSTGNQITETTKTITGFSNEETYYFRITAVLSPLVEGAFSSSASVKVKTGVIPKIKVKWNNVLISYNHGDSITGYQWYNGSTAIANATEQYYVTNILPGSYHVLTTDKNGCLNTSNIITISNAKSLSIFPNPAETRFTLSHVSETMGKAVVSLYNASGIKVLEYQTEKPDRWLYTEIPVENVQSGTYVMELIVNNEDIIYSRVVILK